MAGARTSGAKPHKRTSATLQRALPGASMQRLLEAITREPGLHPREYAERLGMHKGALTSTAAILRRDGLIRSDGVRQNVRYWPTGATGTSGSAATRQLSPPLGEPRTNDLGHARLANGDSGRRRRGRPTKAEESVKGLVPPQLLAALGIETTPAALLGDSVLIVEGRAYRITMRPL